MDEIIWGLIILAMIVSMTLIGIFRDSKDADARGYQRCIDEKTEQSVCYDIYVKKWTNEK